jgi:hypothetical protein
MVIYDLEQNDLINCDGLILDRKRNSFSTKYERFVTKSRNPLNKVDALGHIIGYVLPQRNTRPGYRNKVFSDLMTATLGRPMVAHLVLKI